MAQAPKRFLVWFEKGAVDQAVAAEAVREWAAQERAAGRELAYDRLGTTEFEVISPLPGVSLELSAQMHLKMRKEDPSKLFLCGGVALFPKW